MGRHSKITQEKIEFAAELISAGGKSKREMRDKIGGVFEVSDSTARKILTAAETGATAPQQKTAGDNFDGDPTALFDPANLPSVDDMKKFLAAVNMNIVNNPTGYAKDKTAGSKILISLYNLNQPTDDGEHLNQHDSDMLLCQSLCKILNLPEDAWFFPEQLKEANA